MRTISALFLLFFSGVCFSQEFTARYFGLILEGGATAANYYSNSTYYNTFTNGNNGTALLNSDKDNILLSDLLLEFRTKKLDTLDTEVRFGIGSLKRVSILDGNANYAANKVFDTTSALANTTLSAQTVANSIGLDDQFDINIHYAQLSFSPMRDGYIEFGQLATNLGYEVTPTYANWNNLLGLVWTQQPTYYPGIRFRYEVNQANVYAEFNQNGLEDGNNAWVVGIYGEYMMARYSASYFDTDNGRNIADFMLEFDLPYTIVALNFDYHLLDQTPVGTTDQSAYAVAFYAIPYFQQYYLPIRIEYVNDGQSNIFGLNSAYTLTASPTVYLTENLFLRAEVSYVSSYNSVFRILSNNQTSYTNWSMNGQLGYYF